MNIIYNRYYIHFRVIHGHFVSVIHGYLVCIKHGNIVCDLYDQYTLLKKIIYLKYLKYINFQMIENRNCTSKIS